MLMVVGVGDQAGSGREASSLLTESWAQGDFTSLHFPLKGLQET